MSESFSFLAVEFQYSDDPCILISMIKLSMNFQIQARISVHLKDFVRIGIDLLQSLTRHVILQKTCLVAFAR